MKLATPTGSRTPPSDPRPTAEREDHGGWHLRLLPADVLLRKLPPFVANRLRTHALRAAGLRIGRASAFWGMPTVVGTGDITQRLVIGEHCGFNVGAFFDLEEDVTIGNHVSAGPDVMILTRTYHTGDASQRAGAIVRAPVRIEDGVWLGARCTIMPGVTVGAGAVVGASVVVTQDLPANTLFTGSQKISLAKWR